MTCNYSKRQLENGPVSISCTVITFLTAKLLPKLEVLGFKCCRLYVSPPMLCFVCRVDNIYLSWTLEYQIRPLLTQM